MAYHQINTEGRLKSGVCYWVPEFLPGGRIRLYETWH